MAKIQKGNRDKKEWKKQDKKGEGGKRGDQKELVRKRRKTKKE